MSSVRRQLVPYRRNSLARRRSAISSLMPLLLLAGAALLIYFLFRKKVAPIANYKNKEEWTVKYNEDGLPVSITIHRDARQT